jgi:hypothetical protein
LSIIFLTNDKKSFSIKAGDFYAEGRTPSKIAGSLGREGVLHR